MLRLETGINFRRTNYKTENYYIIYLDVLGTRNIIQKDKNDKYLNELNTIYKDSISYFKFYKKNTFIKIFSDNIVLAEKVCDDLEKDKKNIIQILGLCATIQNISLQYGYFIRGAITKGKFFHNDLFVYGEALVNAVVLEENFAKYPRIIAKKEIANIDKSHFVLDSDGYYYLNSFIYTDIISHGGLICAYKIKLMEQLRANKDNNNVKQKIMWLVDRYNNMSNYQQYSHYPKITSKDITNALR